MPAPAEPARAGDADADAEPRAPRIERQFLLTLAAVVVLELCLVAWLLLS